MCQCTVSDYDSYDISQEELEEYVDYHFKARVGQPMKMSIVRKQCFHCEKDRLLYTNEFKRVYYKKIPVPLPRLIQTFFAKK